MEKAINLRQFHTWTNYGWTLDPDPGQAGWHSWAKTFEIFSFFGYFGIVPHFDNYDIENLEFFGTVPQFHNCGTGNTMQL